MVHMSCAVWTQRLRLLLTRNSSLAFCRAHPTRIGSVRVLQTTIAAICVRTLTAKALRYDSHGDPAKVLKLVETELPSLGSTSVRVSLLAAPINPSDINQVEGVYPIKPPMPAVGGNEGVGVITELGSEVTTLQNGDWVIPGVLGWGTWRTEAVCDARELLRVPNNIPVEYAATLTVNPSTAYRMLMDFVDLKEGEAVIQNGGTSAVARAVIQIAAARGLRTINIIRERPNLADMENTLKALGATYVVTEEFARSPKMRELIASLPGKPRLALNCIGGKSSTQLLRLLAKGGTMVTYGGMAKEPVTVPTSVLIFNDVRLKGFWMTSWYSQNTDEVRMEMFERLAEMVRAGKLTSHFEKQSFENYDSALQAAGSGNAKQLFVFPAAEAL